MRQLLVLLGIGVLGACQERLALPSTCPELCPGSGVEVRDTILDVIVGKDSSFTGYLGLQEPTALLVSNGLPEGDARGRAIFGALPDSVFVVGTRYAYTIDSMLFLVPLLARDTSVKNVRLILHRIPLVDSTATVADLDQYMTAATVVDSVVIPDTLVSGNLRVMIGPESWAKLVPDETDTTRLSVGFRLSADVPTGVRLGSTFGGAGPTWLTYVQVPLTDTTLNHQTITIPADSTNYVIQEPGPSDPDNLFMGGRTGSRTILRFKLPKSLRDSSTVIRATLELTLARPVQGLPNDPATAQALATLVDVGAKSPAFSGAVGVRSLEAGQTGVQKIEVFGPVGTWFGPNGLTPSLLLGLAPEGGTFTRAEFLSSRSPTGGPRLRITYAVPSRSGFP